MAFENASIEYRIKYSTFKPMSRLPFLSLKTVPLGQSNRTLSVSCIIRLLMQRSLIISFQIHNAMIHDGIE
jgi:hypothetical protein